MQKVAQTYFIYPQKRSQMIHQALNRSFYTGKGIIGEYFLSALYTVMFEDFAMSVKYTSTNFKAFFFFNGKVSAIKVLTVYVT